MKMHIPQHVIDAEIENAMQTKMRHKYTATAIVTARFCGKRAPILGFHFRTDDLPNVGSILEYDDGSRAKVVALV